MDGGGNLCPESVNLFSNTPVKSVVCQSCMGEVETCLGVLYMGALDGKEHAYGARVRMFC